MDIGSLLFLFALLLLVGLYIARPILDRKGSISVSLEEHERSALLAERDRAINALQELEFDYTLGKIPEADYPAQRAQMLRYGADILRQLDTYGLDSSEETKRTGASAEDRLEQAVAQQRKVQTPATANVVAANGSNGNGSPDDDLEVMIAQRRRARQGKSAGFCHQCGSPLQQSDRFCPRCGLKIIETS